MNIFILCGGNGKRMNDYSFPKPLNMINGKPLIYYTLANLPKEINELHFIVAPHLIKYNFNEIIINLFPHIKCHFYNLPYSTRGALESAYIGIKDLDLKGSIVFLDNDNLYSFPHNFFKNYNSPFIGFVIDNTNNDNYSFIKFNDNNEIIEIKEKIKISDFICCGVYGFKDIDEFKKYAYKVLTNDCYLSEYYLSMIYEIMINDKYFIQSVKFDNSYHIGTYNDLINNNINLPKMRICFDLDNTIVTYPTIHGDYSTVKPIPNIINLIRKMKNEGHTIIIYTARRMKTHHYNQGAVLADIGEITFKTLKDFNIPYDEIIFGKPIADIYIDDRSINPYINDMNLLGILDYKNIKTPINKIDNNIYNSIEIENGIIKKTGLTKFLQGEIFFYEKINQIDNTDIINLFPIFHKSFIDYQISYIYMENINGIPLYYLYKYELITTNLLLKLLDIVKLLHTYPNIHIDITNKDIINNYTLKLKERFLITDDYPFEDAIYIQNLCLNKLEEYYNSHNNSFNIVNIIHGDLWFSNIIITYSNQIKLIDMKGKIYDKFSISGHDLYDYGKIYQSLLGFDEILYDDNINIEYKKILLDFYENYIISIGIDINDLKTITFSLVIGTLHSITNLEKKKKIWNWIKSIFINLSS